MPAKVIVVENTVGRPDVENYTQSLNELSWDFEFAGRGRKWTNYGSKLEWLLDALSNIAVDSQLVVITASRDVLALRPASDFEQSFQHFNASMVVSMEKWCDGCLETDPLPGGNCVDLARYWSFHGINPQSVPRRFVNSGLLAGTCEALRHWLTWSLEQIKQGAFRADDQVALGQFVCAFPHKIALDVHAQLLHSMGGGCYDGVVDPQSSYDTPTLAELCGRGPYFLHVPGLNGPSHNAQRFYYEMAVQYRPLLRSKLAVMRPMPALGSWHKVV